MKTNLIFTSRQQVATLFVISSIFAYAQNTVAKIDDTETTTCLRGDHFNFVKSSENLKYTMGLFSTNIRSDGKNQLTGISAGLIGGSDSKKVVVDLKYAKSKSDSIFDVSTQLLYYPIESDFSPFLGIGLGSSTREIDGLTSTNLFSNYNLIGSAGVELFQSLDFRIFAGIDFTFPFRKFDANKVEFAKDVSGSSIVTFKQVKGRSVYTVFFVKIGF